MTGPFATLSKYRPLTRLGGGGMADVYLVMAERPGGFSQLQVLKVMRSDLGELERPEFLEMFQDEARLAARLNHPNIVQSFEVGDENGLPYIVMEYLEGQPLHRVQQRARHRGGGFSMEMELFVLCQVLEGLEYAHGLSDYAGRALTIVHRDVSPQNVFVMYSGQTKLVDFGVAKTLESSKTRAGVVKGKVAYMPPEQVISGPLDHRADLFSVGVMLWEAIARQPMHSGLSVFEAMSRLMAGQLPSIRTCVPDVSPELERVVQRALALEPEARYQDAEAFRSELLGYLERTSKVRARDVGGAVSQLFERERSELSQIIRRAVSSEPAPNDEVAPIGRITRRLPREETRASDQPQAAAGTLAAEPEQGEAPTAPAPQLTPISRRSPSPAPGRPRLPRWGFGAVAIVCAIALSMFFLVHLPSSDAHDETVLDSAREPALHLPSRVEAPAAPTPPSIRLTIEVEPKAASLVLDGRVLGQNPYHGQELRDDADHTLVAGAPGYVSSQRTLRFESDIMLALQLERARSERPTAAGAPVVHAPKPQSPPVPAPEAEPYRDLPPPKRIRRPVMEFDKSDPWSSVRAP